MTSASKVIPLFTSDDLNYKIVKVDFQLKKFISWLYRKIRIQLSKANPRLVPLYVTSVNPFVVRHIKSIG